MMTQFPISDLYSMSDPAVIAELCSVLKRIRLQQNLTQEQLAKIAGLSRSAVSQMERGGSGVSFITIIQVLRALQQFQLLSSWKSVDIPSPIAVAKMTSKKRLRASGKIISKNSKAESEW